MIRVTFFTRRDCSLCSAALHVIEKVGTRFPLALELIDISAPGNEQWDQAYRDHIPVVHVNGKEAFRHRVNERKLRSLLTELSRSEGALRRTEGP